MLKLNDLGLKYMNSSEKWIYALPILEEGQLKLRCYMRSRNDLIGVFSRVYTYFVNFNTLIELFNSKSIGQAYNRFVKYKAQRTSFFEQESKETGYFTFDDIKNDAIKGRTSFVLEITNYLMKLNCYNFTYEAITEKEKEDILEIQKQQKEILNLGYDY